VFISFLVILCLPCSTLFPYTTLFRSEVRRFWFFVSTPLGHAFFHPSLNQLDLILCQPSLVAIGIGARLSFPRRHQVRCDGLGNRSEEHTSELQSRFDLVCRLLLEKKK